MSPKKTLKASLHLVKPLEQTIYTEAKTIIVDVAVIPVTGPTV